MVKGLKYEYALSGPASTTGNDFTKIFTEALLVKHPAESVRVAVYVVDEDGADG